MAITVLTMCYLGNTGLEKMLSGVAELRYTILYGYGTKRANGKAVFEVESGSYTFVSEMK